MFIVTLKKQKIIKSQVEERIGDARHSSKKLLLL